MPGMIGGLLDKRAAQIRSDLDEARALREEAQTCWRASSASTKR
jgi:F-type H+-transporting ATPase subunit b